MIKKTILLLAIAITTLVQAQSKEGYWDNVRTTNETLTLKAGAKKYIKSADLPPGTTEIVYRISLLDNNQKISGSLVSILKAIPDPTGISQGSAGALFLATTVAGDDKCKYALFTSATDAENYTKGEALNTSCYVQDTPINKEAKLISITNSKCLTPNTKNLWFVFESDNWVLNQKIVLEIVPWVDYKMARGWNADTKNEIITLCANLSTTKRINKKDTFCGYFLDAIMQKYTYKQYSELLAAEKNKEIATITEQCLQKTGEKSVLLTAIRAKANELFNNNKIEEAIQLLQTEVLNKGYQTALDYNALGKFYLYSKQYQKALQALQKGEELDNANLQIQLNLAHVYLFMDKLSQAKAIHKKYYSQNISANVSWIQQTESDFKALEKQGFPTDDFKKILRIFN